MINDLNKIKEEVEQIKLTAEYLINEFTKCKNLEEFEIEEVNSIMKRAEVALKLILRED